MKIVLCVPVPNGGRELLSLLAESAASLASGAHQIEIDFTCHGDQERDAILESRLALPVARYHIISREEPTYFHANSVTHSRCISALFSSVDADIAVISDFDMALVCKGWDELLAEKIGRGDVAFLGTAYGPGVSFDFVLPTGPVKVQKYQGKPNCMFVAFSVARIKSLASRICDFAETYSQPDSIPMKFISTPANSREYGLPVGSFLHVDTGNRIPQIIEKHRLKHLSLERRTSNYKVLKSVALPLSYPHYLLPEEYWFDGAPFLTHFRKGASKPTIDATSYPIQAFTSDVRSWIATLASG